MKKDPPIVYVEWVDSTNPGGCWTDLSDLPKMLCRSAGFLVKSKKDRIVLAVSIDSGPGEKPEHVTGEFQIPRCAIRKFVEL